MNRQLHFLLLGAFCILTGISLLNATEAPTITVRKSDALNISFTGIGGSEGAAASKVLQSDLNLAGWFSLVQPGMGTFSISGTFAGGVLQGRVVKAGETVLERAYQGNARAAAHHFADDIVQTLTGHRGIATSTIAFVSTRTGHKAVSYTHLTLPTNREV